MKAVTSYLLIAATLGSLAIGNVSSAAGKKKHPGYSKAKKACLVENAKLRGKALQKCIKGKLHKKSVPTAQ